MFPTALSSRHNHALLSFSLDTPAPNSRGTPFLPAAPAQSLPVESSVIAPHMVRNSDSFGSLPTMTRRASASTASSDSAPRVYGFGGPDLFFQG
jgi:hypothetical protein